MSDDLDTKAQEFAAAMAERLKEHNLVMVPREMFRRAFQVALLGQKMREAQRQYFKTRSRDDLVASKVAERAFDFASAALDAEREPTPDA